VKAFASNAAKLGEQEALAMSDYVRVHCRHCEQTFLTKAGNTGKCDLCGKDDGLVAAIPEVREVDRRSCKDLCEGPPLKLKRPLLFVVSVIWMGGHTINLTIAGIFFLGYGFFLTFSKNKLESLGPYLVFVGLFALAAGVFVGYRVYYRWKGMVGQESRKLHDEPPARLPDVEPAEKSESIRTIHSDPI
jgi:hypothetical protein